MLIKKPANSFVCVHRVEWERTSHVFGLSTPSSSPFVALLGCWSFFNHCCFVSDSNSSCLDSGVGKSSVLQRWHTGQFMKTTSTINLELMAKTFVHKDDVVRFQLYVPNHAAAA